MKEDTISYLVLVLIAIVFYQATRSSGTIIFVKKPKSRTRTVHLPHSLSSLTPGESLDSTTGNKLYSPDQTIYMYTQNDGNLVKYRNSTFVAASLSHSMPHSEYTTEYGADGLLHTINRKGEEIWNSRAWGWKEHEARKLTLRNDGLLCSYSSTMSTPVYCHRTQTH